MFEKTREVFSFLKRTPLHPQWHVFRNQRKTFSDIAKFCRGLTLDLGCGTRLIEPHLDKSTTYVGMDYLATVRELYRTSPDVFGDAANLPLADLSVDTLLLLDVLEHIPEPVRCIQEARRILRPAGRLVLQVPFVYPLHDAPRDYTRWSIHGLEQIAANHGFRIIHREVTGHPMETAAMLSNIAFSRQILTAAQRLHPFCLLAVVLPVMTLFTNTVSWLVAAMEPNDGFMPFRCRIVLEKS